MMHSRGFSIVTVALCLLLGAMVPAGRAQAESRTPASGKVYVTSWFSGVISIIDLEKEEVVKTILIAAGAGTHGISFAAGGKLLLVTNTGAGTVSIIDTGNDEVIKSIKVATAPEGIAFKRP